jgi:dihydrofolate reductase
MRALHLKMSMSVDGFVGGPDGEADWIFSTTDPQSDAWEIPILGNTSLHLMGSNTYVDMLAWWPYSDEIYAPPMNAIPKAVFTHRDAAALQRQAPSRTVQDADAARKQSGGVRREADPEVLQRWENPYIASGPLEEEIATLKRGDGKALLAHGGAGFARSLIATGLVDRFYLLVHPVVLGKGLPIFTRLDARLPLRLESSTAFPKGATGMVYVPEH